MTKGHASNELVKKQAKGEGHNSAEVKKGYVLRLEKLDEEMKDIRDAKKSIKNEAKDNGITSRALNEVIRQRKMEPETLTEFIDEVDDLKLACGMLPHFEAAEEVAKSKQAAKSSVGTSDSSEAA